MAVEARVAQLSESELDAIIASDRAGRLKVATLDDKRARARAILLARQRAAREGPGSYRAHTWDMFLESQGREPVEMARFDAWVQAARSDALYGFELENCGANEAVKEVVDERGQRAEMLNFGSYGYLGLNRHPAVLRGRPRGPGDPRPRRHQRPGDVRHPVDPPRLRGTPRRLLRPA